MPPPVWQPLGWLAPHSDFQESFIVKAQNITTTIGYFENSPKTLRSHTEIIWNLPSSQAPL